MEKCVCHINGYAIKDATARKELAEIKQTAVTAEDVNRAIEDAITTVIKTAY